MGDSYREYLKTRKRAARAPRTGPAVEARMDRDDQARNARREAIKREQSRKALSWGKKKKATQGRLM